MPSSRDHALDRRSNCCRLCRVSRVGMSSSTLDMHVDIRRQIDMHIINRVCNYVSAVLKWSDPFFVSLRSYHRTQRTLEPGIIPNPLVRPRLRRIGSHHGDVVLTASIAESTYPDVHQSKCVTIRSRLRSSRYVLRLAFNSTCRSRYCLECAEGFHVVPILRRKLVPLQSLAILRLHLESLSAVSLYPSV